MLVQYFTYDDTVTAKIKEEAKGKEGVEGKLKKMFTSEAASDDDIIKDLKTQSIDELLNELESYEGDEIAYTVELIKRFYLE